MDRNKVACQECFLLPSALIQEGSPQHHRIPVGGRGASPHHQQFSDSSWAPSIQVHLTPSTGRWHQTPQAHQTVPAHLRFQSQVQVSPTLLRHRLQVGGSHHPLLGLESFARAAPRTQRNVSLTRSQVYYKKV